MYINMYIASSAPAGGVSGPEPRQWMALPWATRSFRESVDLDPIIAFLIG